MCLILKTGYNAVEVFTLAEKLTDLFKAMSNTKLTLNEQTELNRFQMTVMGSWANIMNSVKNVEPGKAIDAYIAIINNKQELLSQFLNIFNMEQLTKFSQTLSDTLKTIDNSSVNCNSTVCLLTTTPTPIYNSNTTTQQQQPQNATWFSTWFTSLPQNFTEILSNTTRFPFTSGSPSNYTTVNWSNETTSTYRPSNFTTSYPVFNSTWFTWTTQTFNSSTWNSSSFPTTWFNNNTTSFPSTWFNNNTTSVPFNTTVFFSNYTTSVPFNTTGFASNYTTFYPNSTWYTSFPQNFSTVWSTSGFNTTSSFSSNFTSNGNWSASTSPSSGFTSPSKIEKVLIYFFIF
jgi:hypothetical protein